VRQRFDNFTSASARGIRPIAVAVVVTNLIGSFANLQHRPNRIMEPLSKSGITKADTGKHKLPLLRFFDRR
jgi:hypothetical protein